MLTKPLAARHIEARGRARQQLAKVHVIRHAHEYKALSQTEPGTIHFLTRGRSDWMCSCSGWRYTSSCYHLGQLQRRSAREGWTFGRIALSLAHNVHHGGARSMSDLHIDRHNHRNKV